MGVDSFMLVSSSTIVGGEGAACAATGAVCARGGGVLRNAISIQL